MSRFRVSWFHKGNLPAPIGEATAPPMATNGRQICGVELEAKTEGAAIKQVTEAYQAAGLELELRGCACVDGRKVVDDKTGDKKK